VHVCQYKANELFQLAAPFCNLPPPSTHESTVLYSGISVAQSNCVECKGNGCETNWQLFENRVLYYNRGSCLEALIKTTRTSQCSTFFGLRSKIGSSRVQQECFPLYRDVRSVRIGCGPNGHCPGHQPIRGTKTSLEKSIIQC
jgi:hypothetical protein